MADEAQKCAHGSIEVYPSNNPDAPGFARCASCGARLTDGRSHFPSDGVGELVKAADTLTQYSEELVRLLADQALVSTAARLQTAINNVSTAIAKVKEAQG